MKQRIIKTIFSSQGSGSWLSTASRPSNSLGVSRFLDVDGLNVLEDPYTTHTQNMHTYYAACLRRQQRVINTLLYHLSARNGASKCTDDLVSVTIYFFYYLRI